MMKVLVEAHGMPKDEVFSKLDAAKQCMIDHYIAHKDR